MILNIFSGNKRLFCHPELDENTNLSPWEYTNCTKDCDYGLQTGTRNCTADCCGWGSTEETAMCNAENCPGNYIGLHVYAQTQEITYSTQVAESTRCFIRKIYETIIAKFLS